MGDTIKLNIPIPYDEEGMIGRECLECKRYFKLKPGTGLPTSYCHCPYCEYEGASDTFWTPAQLEYAKSVATNEIFRQFVKPSLDKLTNTFKDLERKTRNSFFQIKIKTTNQEISVPVQYYTEAELETKMTCNHCSLVFAVYGVFARCPDCNELNAFFIFEKSVEITQKQIKILSKPEIPKEIGEHSVSLILSSCVSAFDGLGKELKKRKPNLYPDKPKNLFQNISLLNSQLENVISKNHSDYEFLFKMFQVRHIYEHNMGVIDIDFTKKVPALSNMLGRKYLLTLEELERFTSCMKELGRIIMEHFR